MKKFIDYVIEETEKAIPSDLYEIEDLGLKGVQVTIKNWVMVHRQYEWKHERMVCIIQPPSTAEASQKLIYEMNAKIAIRYLLEGYERMVDKLTGKKALWDMYLTYLKNQNEDEQHGKKDST